MSAVELARSYDYPYRGDRSSVDLARQNGNLDQLIAQLASLIDTADTNLKVGAIEALSHIEEAKKQEVVKAFMRVLNNDVYRDYQWGGTYTDEEDIRSPASEAAKALGSWKVEEAVDLLAENVLNPKINPLARYEAIKALGNIGTKNALLYLEPLRNSDEVFSWGIYSKTEIPVKILIGDILDKFRQP